MIKADLREVTVPLSKLSERDKSYIKKFTKARRQAVMRGEMPAVLPELPDVEAFDTAFGSTSTIFRGTEIAPKPLGATPKFLSQFKTSGVGFDKIRRDQNPVAAIPVGGPDQLVLVTARERNPFDKGDEFQSQLYWVSLAKKKVINFVSITHEDYAIDYDPTRKLLLTFNRNEEFIGQNDDADNYTLWKLAPGEEFATPIRRWRGKGMGMFENLFGKIIDENTVLAKTSRQTYEAWDLEAKKSLYVIKQQSFFDAPVTLTFDRKHLIVPEDGQLAVVDAKTGEAYFYASVDTRHLSGANVNAAGDRLAAVDNDEIFVWDLTADGNEPTVYPAPLVGSPFRSHVYWVGR